MKKASAKCLKMLEFTFRLLKIERSDNALAGLMQFIKFGIVGFSNTVVGYLIYVATLNGLRAAKLWAGIDIYVAQLVMFILSVAWSFYWNNKMVFKQENGEKRNVFTALIKTYVSYAFTSLFLAEVLLLLWVKILRISEYIAPVITLIVTVPLNFLIQKFWAFRKNDGDNKNGKYK